MSTAHDSAVKKHGEGARTHRTAFASPKHWFEKVGDHWKIKERNGPSEKQSEKSGAAERQDGLTAGTTHRPRCPSRAASIGLLPRNRGNHR